MNALGRVELVLSSLTGGGTVTTTTTRMVLITDLRESTDLRVRIGDGAFDALRREHYRLLGEAAVAHGATS